MTQATKSSLTNRVSQWVNFRAKDDGLTLVWPDGGESFFHFIWLRNCCYCSHCGDTHTGKRFLQPCDVALDIQASDVRIDENRYLNIVWAPDGHSSSYDLEWLKRHAYEKAERNRRRQRSILWDGSVSSHPPTVNYQAAVTDDDAYLGLLRKLRDFGFVIVKDGPRGQGKENSSKEIEQVAGLLGELADAAYGKVFELTPKLKDLTLGNTTHPVPPHTDESYLHTPTGILILYCVTPAEDGGETVLVDGFNLAETLRKENPDAFRLLATQPQDFHRVVPDEGIDQRTRAKVLVLDEDGEVVGFRFHTRTNAPLDAPVRMVKPIHAANFALSELMLDENNHAQFKLEAGDAVMFDNHRVMHSRLGFSDPNRYLQICNVSRERFHQKLRFTANRLGYCSEAIQVLNTGVSG